MKLHHVFLAIAAVCVAKFATTPTTDESLWLLPAAMGAFLIGCVTASFADDKAHGDNATRNGLMLYGAFILFTKMATIAAVIVALILVATH